MFDAEMIEAFREFKSIWDPQWKMNPGKLIDPYRVDENLRLGSNWNPPHVETHFQYPDDKHSFAQATERCVGRSEEHTSELQSHVNLVCRLLLEKKKINKKKL